MKTYPWAVARQPVAPRPWEIPWREIGCVSHCAPRGSGGSRIGALKAARSPPEPAGDTGRTRPLASCYQARSDTLANNPSYLPQRRTKGYAPSGAGGLSATAATMRQTTIYQLITTYRPPGPFQVRARPIVVQ